MPPLSPADVTCNSPRPCTFGSFKKHLILAACAALTFSLTLNGQARRRLDGPAAPAQGRQLVVQSGHAEGGVTCVAHGPDGALMATADGDAKIKVWEASTSRLLRTIAADSVSVVSLAFAPDGVTLAAGGLDGGVSIWDATTGQKKRFWKAFELRLYGLVFHPRQANLLIISGKDGDALTGKQPDVKFWDAANAKPLKQISVAGSVYQLELNAAKNLLAGTSYQEIYVWDATTGEERLKIKIEKGDYISKPVFTPDGKQLIAAVRYATEEDVEDGETKPNEETTPVEAAIKVWNTESGKEVRSIQGGPDEEHFKKVIALALSPDGEVLASGGEDTHIILWKLSTGHEIKPLLGNAGYVNGLSFSLDGRRLVSAGADGSVRVWETATDAEVVLLHRAAPAYTAAFSPDGKELISGHERAVKLWDLATGGAVRTLRGNDGPVKQVEFSRNGKLLAALDKDVVAIWERSTLELKLRLVPNTLDRRFTAFALSPDARVLVVGSGSDKYSFITFWDVASATLLGRLTTQPAQFLSLAFSPNGKLLAGGSNDGGLTLWQLGDASMTITKVVAGSSAEKSGFRVGDIITGVDGIRFVTGREMYRYLVSPAKRGRKVPHVRRGADETDIPYVHEDDPPLDFDYGPSNPVSSQTLPGHRGAIVALAFSNDGDRLASGDAHVESPVVKLWDVKTRSEVRSFAGDGRAAVGFSPDGKRLAWRSGGELKLWDVQAGREAVSVPHAQPVFSPDGRYVVGFDDDALTFHEVSTARQVGWAEAVNELDWVVSNEEQQIDGSHGGLERLHYRNGKHTAPLSDGFAEAYRPGLLAEMAPPATRSGAQPGRGHRRSGAVTYFALPDDRPPVLKLVEGGTPPTATGVEAERTRVFSFDVSDIGGGIGAVSLNLNGDDAGIYATPRRHVGIAPTYGSGARTSVSAKYEVLLSIGANNVRLLAHNRDETQWSEQVFDREYEEKKVPETGTKSEYRRQMDALLQGGRELLASLRKDEYERKVYNLQTLVNHGNELVLRDQNYAAAQKWFAYALRLGEHELGSSDRALAIPLQGLSGLEVTRGNFKAAEALLKRAIGVCSRSNNTSPAELAQVIDLIITLARLYTVMGDLAQAQSIYQRLIEKFRNMETALLLPLLQQFTEIATDYVTLLKAQGEEELAAEGLLSVSELTEDLGKKVANDPDLAQNEKLTVVFALRELPKMFLLLYRGNREHYAEFMEAQVKVEEARHGESSLEVMLSLLNLSSLYLVEGRNAEAEKALLRARSIKELFKLEGFVFDSAFDRGAAYLALSKGDPAAAREAAARALKSFQQSGLLASHPDAVMVRYLLALSYRFEGRYAEAEAELLQAATASEAVSGRKSPMSLEIAAERVVLAQLRGDFRQALALQTDINRITEQNVAGALAIRSEGLKQGLLSGLERQTDAAISLLVNTGGDNVEARRLALTSVLQRKGRLLDALTGASRALRRGLSPADQQLFDDLSAKRTKLATLVVRSAGQAASEGVQVEIRSLEVEVGKLEGKLSGRSKEFYAQVRPVTPELVQGALPKGAALVEFVAYRPLNLRAKSLPEMYGPPRYVAFILPQAGEPQAVELGAAADIDELAQTFRAALRNWSNVPKAKEAGRKLYDSVMLPILRRLGSRPGHLFVSPEGKLNLVPFAALVDERGEYLVQNYLVTYLTSGRDLLRPLVRDGVVSNPVVVADPDFDSAAATAQPEPPGPSVLRHDGFKETFARLEDTAREAETLLRVYPKALPFTRRQATEAALKKVHRPLVLHIATHGFFHDAVRPAPEAGTRALLFPASPASALGEENPLLRSGLALAGANQLQSGDNEDGILTALEISALDLTGTELVVLSACETGVGAVASGEGVYGLRRALILAGSESQMMSLWKVNDEATHELMIDYYNNLQAGAGRAEALRKSQLKLLGLPNGTPGTAARVSTFAHPYFWSGFIQSGRWEAMKPGGR